MYITLNGNQYHLEAGTQVARETVLEWPDNIRLDGQQKRKDRRWLSAWAIDKWSNGLGLERMNPDISGELYRLWDAENCDTRWDFGIILSPAFNTCTIVPSRGDLDVHFDFGAELYFAETQRAGVYGSLVGGFAYQFSPPYTIGSYRGIGYSSFTADKKLQVGSISAIKDFGGEIAFIAVGTCEYTPNYATYGNYLVHVPTLGGGGSLRLENSLQQIGTEHITRLSQIGDFGGTVHIMVYTDALKDVRMWTADRSFWNVSLKKTVPNVIGTYLAPLVTDGLTMFAQLPEGVYDFDASPAIAVDTSRAKDKNCSQVMFGQNLYFKNKKSLIKYDGTDTEGVGYDLEDGLMGEKLGEITAMTSSWKYTFAAVKGATYSHILSREESGAWQYYARIPSAGLWVRDLWLSDAPDAIDRLWCIFGNHKFPGYFLNPMVNPLQAGTYHYVPTGHFTKPIYGAGMDEILGGFYDNIVTADEIGTVNSITAFYGLNGESPVTTLGVCATGHTELVFGSPYGLEAYRIQPKFMLSGGTVGTTPIFRNALIHYLKIPKEREQFGFTIDLEETVRTGVRPLEAVIGSLNYERQSRTLMPFSYGQIATKNVRVLEMPAQEELEGNKIFQGERSGFTRVRVVEIL